MESMKRVASKGSRGDRRRTASGNSGHADGAADEEEKEKPKPKIKARQQNE